MFKKLLPEMLLSLGAVIISAIIFFPLQVTDAEAIAGLVGILCVIFCLMPTITLWETKIHNYQWKNYLNARLIWGVIILALAIMLFLRTDEPSASKSGWVMALCLFLLANVIIDAKKRWKASRNTDLSALYSQAAMQ